MDEQKQTEPARLIGFCAVCGFMLDERDAPLPPPEMQVQVTPIGQLVTATIQHLMTEHPGEWAKQEIFGGSLITLLATAFIRTSAPEVAAMRQQIADSLRGVLSVIPQAAAPAAAQVIVAAAAPRPLQKGSAKGRPQIVDFPAPRPPQKPVA